MKHDTTPATEAMRRGNRYAGWKKGGEHAAMCRLNTCRLVVPESAPSFSLSKDSSVFAIGSCFARNIEEALMANNIEVKSFDLEVPYKVRSGRKRGIINKYNPVSMLHELEWAAGKEFPTKSLMEMRPGKMVDPSLKVGEVAQDIALVLEFRKTLVEYFQRVRDCDLVIITLGMIECWKDLATGVVLNQTPHPRMVRREPGRYVFVRLTADEVWDAVWGSLALLRQAGVANVVLSVSPVSLHRTFTGQDVMTASCYSKSVLRVVAEQFAQNFEWVDYFPSYEAAMYGDPAKVWESDRLHVRDSAVQQIMTEFIKRYMKDHTGATL